MYTALYRTFRPETFETVIGQNHIVRILKNQITAGQLAHSYLFCGTRGTGKTTTARLLAKAVNCLSDSDKPCGVCANCREIQNGTFVDVIEIDAASNNGVDNIRELRESVNYPPFIGKSKVYIIDEVHMLSSGAFNALLKTLEEPPEGVMFILATTEPQKLPATILSRCLRLDFRRVPEKTLTENMQRICEARGVEAEQSALALIAINADGSVRDSLSLLEQCMSGAGGRITHDGVAEMLGTAGEESFIRITANVLDGDVVSALLMLDDIIADGKDVKQFMKDWMAHFRNLLITKFIDDSENSLNMSCENIERVKEQSALIEQSVLSSYITELAKTLSDAKWSTQPRVLLELCIVKMATQDMSGQQGMPQPERRMSDKKIRIGASKTVKDAGKTAIKDEVKKAFKDEVKTVAAGDLRDKEQDADLNDAYDNDEIWQRIVDEGGSIKGSFQMLRTGAYIKEIRGNECLVVADNIGASGYIEMNKGMIEGLIEKVTGKRRVLRCVSGDSEQEKTAPNEEVGSLAEEWAKKLGVPVEIQ